MKEVVIFNDHFQSGGVESLWANLLKNIDDKNYHFTLLVTQKETDIYDDILNSKNIRVVKILDKPIKNPIKRTYKNSKLFKAKIKELKPDILHINSCNTSGLKLASMAKACGVKNVIVHSHNTKIENDKLHLKGLANFIWQKRYNKEGIHHFGCSTESLEFMFKSKDGILLKNGVDLDKFKFNLEFRKEIREKYNISDDTYLIGHIGRFCEQKNHKGLIDIFNNYQKMNQNSKLLLVGEGELFEEIKNYVKSLNLDQKVIFAGTTKESYKFYSAFDVFLLPSLHEGLPVVAIEAEASSLPSALATTISSEAKITSICQMLDLNDINSWTNFLDKYKGYQRSDNQEEVISSGFDIKKSSRDLIDFYNKL